MCYTFLETFLSIELEYVKKKVFLYCDHWSLTPVKTKKTLSHFFKKKILFLFLIDSARKHFFSLFFQGIFSSKHLPSHFFNIFFLVLSFLDSARKHLFFYFNKKIIITWRQFKIAGN